MGPKKKTRADRLRVAIDAHMVGEKETGNETYIVNLIRDLVAIDSDTDYFLYSPHPESLSVCGPFSPSFSIRRVRPGTSFLRIPFAMPSQARADHVDVLHVTYVAPPVTAVPIVATVHDISYALFPETFSQRDKFILGTMVPRTLRQARAVITVSESSKRDIVSHYGTTPEKIHVVYQPVSPTFRQVTDAGVIQEVRQRFGIDTRYIVAVGNLQPRKNLPRLIRAFASLRQAGSYDGRLVLIGKNKFKESDIYQEVRRLGLEREIILTGYVAEQDLASLYSGADALVYPSLYEGYGLPPIEAMTCGCPVIASNSSSLPEVVGDAGILVDPTSIDDLAAAIANVTAHPELQRMLTSRGLERARIFNKSSAASQTLDIYRHTAGISARASVSIG